MAIRFITKNVHEMKFHENVISSLAKSLKTKTFQNQNHFQNKFFRKYPYFTNKTCFHLVLRTSLFIKFIQAQKVKNFLVNVITFDDLVS